ncbi:Uncharacterized protein YqkB [Paenibacillus sp. UNCCL117]|uniref:iron-sulfur cluster biosynthesis family protein n=1 Tax=unclassified Paenibacillus TaxID=185978 RepID=UPI00088DA726|nr:MULTISPECIES: iron-sulfur cluster biosynthesis family protein [unclassified Paenibacillus]SDC45238.1 Uncharacterized protein YqkB [Paenibacillus sp. cl123]SFW12552.1 Uncharacterized protein YqkB [Paenibacillus sp. UNCCL117]
MQITCTEQAAAVIEQHFDARQSGVLRLVYDNEGCGCAVNGVPTLWIENAPQPNDLAIVTSGLAHALWIDKKHEIYFEDFMTLDYKSEGRSFILKSRGQIYNAHMNLVDKRV